MAHGVPIDKEGRGLLVSTKVATGTVRVKRTKGQILWREIKKHYMLYLMFLPALVFFIVFSYAPMVGLLQAFKEFRFDMNVFQSPWVGLKYFEKFFSSYRAPLLLRNTIVIGLIKTILEFPFAIILALMINEVRNLRFKKSIQTISYLPYFISTVVAVALLDRFLAPDIGILNQFKSWLGLSGETFYMMEGKYFYGILFGLDIWKGIGWGSIIYLAAIAGIDQQLYEAARIDGATKWREIWHITLPGIKFTAGIQFILGLGGLVSTGYEQLLLLRNPGNMNLADTLDVFVIEQGLSQGNYAYATAVGLAQGIVGLILVVLANKLVKKYTEVSVW